MRCFCCYLLTAVCVSTVWKDIPCIHVQVCVLLLVSRGYRALQHALFSARAIFWKQLGREKLLPETIAVYKMIERKHSMCTAKAWQLGKGNERDHLACAFMAGPPTYAGSSFLSCHLAPVRVLTAPKYT